LSDNVYGILIPLESRYRPLTIEEMARKSEISPRLSKLLARIAGNIERLRKVKGLTQAETAERLDGDLRWYQRLESGKHVLSLDTLTRLAHAFRVDVSEFFRS
jgi:DNA-binding XRE family transcriptional regulator